MAIRFVDSCDHYETADLPRKYNAVNSALILTSSGRRGSGCLRLFTSTVRVEKDVPANDTYGVSCAVRSISSWGTTDDIIIFKEGATVHMTLQVRSDNRLYAMRGGSVELSNSGDVRIPQQSWTHLEVKCKVADSGGTFEVHMNGKVISSMTVASDDTRNGGAVGTIDRLTLEGLGIGELYVDDIVIWDDTGAAPYNDFMGDVRIDAVLADGDGGTNDFTPVGTGSTNADRIDESPAIDDDDTYNHDSVANDVDLYTYAALPASPGTATVFAVQAVLTAKKDDSGTREIAAIARPVSTNRIGTSQVLSTDYLMFREIWQVSPETSVAWTETEIDGAEFGTEVSV